MHNLNTLTPSRWLFFQLKTILGPLVDLFIIGVPRAILRREFGWRTFFIGSVVQILGVCTLSYFLGTFSDQFRMSKSSLFWCGLCLVSFTSGIVLSKQKEDLPFWETYAASLMGAMGLWIELAQGWRHLLVRFSSSISGDGTGFWRTLLGVGQPSSLAGFIPLNPGYEYFGGLWTNLYPLLVLTSFGLTLVGVSIGYMSASRLFRGRRFEWVMSLRHLRGGESLVSRTAVITVIGVAVGVAALVVVNSIMSGYQQDIQDKLLTTNPHLVVQKYGTDFEEHAEIKEKGMSVEGVIGATPFTFTEAMMAGPGGRAAGVLVKGIEPQTASSVTAIENALCDPQFLGQRCVRGGEVGEKRLESLLIREEKHIAPILVGYGIFQQWGLKQGQLVRITTPVGIAGAQVNAPKQMTMRVMGAFQSGIHEFDMRLIYLRLIDAQSFMGLADSVSGVEFRIENPANVEKVTNEVLSSVGRYPYHATDWRQLNAGIFTALKLQKVVMFLVLIFIIVVAAFNIASTLFMTVVERSHEIGILKSMGARNSSIMGLFVTEGLILGGLGSVIGVGMGLGVCFLLSHLDLGISADVYMVDALKIQVRVEEILVVMFVSLVISFLATVFPALKAARQSPVDALRFE